jgi:hypothetical protein
MNGLSNKERKLKIIMDELCKPPFLSQIDLFQRLAYRIYLEYLHIDCADVATLGDVKRITIPVMGSYISDQDIDTYLTYKYSEENKKQMEKYELIKELLDNIPFS